MWFFKVILKPKKQTLLLFIFIVLMNETEKFECKKKIFLTIEKAVYQDT